jgi:hypothetical protein
MIKLPNTFNGNKRDDLGNVIFTILDRYDTLVILERSDNQYEVVNVKVSKDREFKIKGRTVVAKAKEYLPSGDVWDGYTTNNRRKAFDNFYSKVKEMYKVAV